VDFAPPLNLNCLVRVLPEAPRPDACSAFPPLEKGTLCQPIPGRKQSHGTGAPAAIELALLIFFVGTITADGLPWSVVPV